MLVYFLVLLILLLIPIAGIIWGWNIYKLYRNGKTRAFKIQGSIWAALVVFVLWILELFPYSSNIDAVRTAHRLTGKYFWCTEEFSYSDFSVRGEGYYLYIFSFNEKTAEYFERSESDLTSESNSFKRWFRTPIDSTRLSHATPVWGPDEDLLAQQYLVKKIAKDSGSYYTYQKNNYYIISPRDRLFIMIFNNE